MRVLTGEEVDRLERASLPPEYRDWIAGLSAPCGIFERLRVSGYVTQSRSRGEDGIMEIVNFITPRGQLALRCHRAFLASNGAST